MLSLLEQREVAAWRHSLGIRHHATSLGKLELEENGHGQRTLPCPAQPVLEHDFRRERSVVWIVRRSRQTRVVRVVRKLVLSKLGQALGWVARAHDKLNLNIALARTPRGSKRSKMAILKHFPGHFTELESSVKPSVNISNTVPFGRLLVQSRKRAVRSAVANRARAKMVHDRTVGGQVR